jgi:hypothetical protein
VFSFGQARPPADMAIFARAVVEEGELLRPDGP